MKIAKALITVADPRQRTLPLQTLIDQDGRKKSALEIVLEEAASAGIEEIGLVICPGDQESYSKAAGALADRIRFIEQAEPAGYAQAILLGRSFVGSEPFLHLVGDHLCVSETATSCAKQLVKIAEGQSGCVSAVQATRESLITSFGAVGGRLAANQEGLYTVDRVLEKPTPTEAELKILVPGLRAGYFLCFFGMHVLTPSIFAALEETTARPGPDRRFLSTALDLLCRREKFLAFEVAGSRYDVGSGYGLLFAQLALAFVGKDRDHVLSGLVEMLARSQA